MRNVDTKVLKFRLRGAVKASSIPAELVPDIISCVDAVNLSIDKYGSINDEELLRRTFIRKLCAKVRTCLLHRGVRDAVITRIISIIEKMR